MTNLQEVPTEELLSFQDYSTVHDNTTIPISAAVAQPTNFRQDNFDSSPNLEVGGGDAPNADQNSTKAFWTLEYYQKFFDVDTKDVVERIIASITPKWDNNLKHHLRTKPDLYGPFWISITLIFTLAISGNIANYLQHKGTNYHWKYDFHMVTFAATVISLYVTLVPSILWGLLKWSVQVTDVEGLTSDLTPGALELICIYGYSLFIYIPVSVLWSIQIVWLQWTLVFVATMVSGSVLLLTIMPALRLSRYKFFLILGIVCCHLLLATAFMLYFFRANDIASVAAPPPSIVEHTTIMIKEQIKANSSVNAKILAL